ncbi:complement factor H-like isoform X2 [Sinocyclocheilus rhinocerous]|uniref:complement factor H-like isoform X2 n=1 Tax=Sinocyclocheilus rhinocerous TaxID=307959 RepID=UPI0007BA8B95|nr:PREDICTED: complement factor H-like isoform X2 [Sinocyclocheilus rhinocerous]
MRVPVKLLGFGFWLFFLNCARCQECLREDIKHENTEPVEKASYAHGEIVKVNCITGYTGLYRLNCEKGEWKKSIERPCAKRRCSHPGDTPNGDFKLIKGTEYLFGTTVVYNCKKGYEMASRINYRTCRAQGWDNAVPVCEVVKCPAIRTDWEVTASGNTEEGRYGDAIHFECVSSDKMIDGNSDIRCEETGKWSDAVPKCKVPHGSSNTAANQKLCPDLSVENGFIYSHSFNKEKIFYSCNTGYKPFTGNWWDSVTCSKGSWSDEPRCIRKEDCGALPSVHHGKLIHRDRETAEVECDPGFISTEPFIKCTSGRWETPVCKEVRCGIPPNVENAVITSEPKEFYLPGSTVTYICRSSYLMNEKSTVFCQSGTWENTPTCQGQREITCQSNGEWSSPFPKCEGKHTEVTCELKSTTFGVKKIKPEEKNIFRAGESVELTCSEKYWFLGTKETSRSFTCKDNGEWDYEPVCAEITCETPHDQHVYYPSYSFSGDKKRGAKKSYRCESGYREMAEEATCTRDGWTPKPLCAVSEKCGPPPGVNDADTLEITKKEYNTGERVEYSCFNKYTLDLRPPFSRYLTCEQGEWRGNIRCLKPCTVTVEEMERRGLELAYANRQKMFAPHDDHITFMCQRGKVSGGVPLRQQCNDGVITLPECVRQ